MKPALPPQQRRVAELAARGMPDKLIAHQTGLALKTVQNYMQIVASKIPGDGPPRRRFLLFFFDLHPATDE